MPLMFYEIFILQWDFVLHRNESNREWLIVHFIYCKNERRYFREKTIAGIRLPDRKLKGGGIIRPHNIFIWMSPYKFD